MYSDLPIIGESNSTEIISITELSPDKFYNIKVKTDQRNIQSINTLQIALKENNLKGIITDENITFELFSDFLSRFTPEQAAKVYEVLYEKSNLVNPVAHELSK